MSLLLILEMTTEDRQVSMEPSKPKWVPHKSKHVIIDEMDIE